MMFAASTTLLLAFAAQSAFAVTLYRNGGANKPYNKVRTPQDYDSPVNGIVPANPNKGMSTNSNRGSLPNQNKNVWSIDSDNLSTGRLKPVNDHDTHWAITLTQDTQIDELLDAINNADGWSKVNQFISLNNVGY
ncbi:hypothetical protein OF83DRAFT_1176706 [Amylostereum chailletii]|nr:hypothetical protein OF83DRAFT_1176706 [Amylostereum chailletii]